ncbi:MAG TPA: lytic transglycosylase domain-containing protein [Terracidiphilus sp.]|nr:lytic transglycosylase domain-containing protein [Terracidiphilus sp.]
MQHKFFLIAAVLIILTPSARAAERVTLRNGSQMLCDHHTQVEAGVRLYLSAGQDNYIQFAPQDVRGIEPAPDLPASLGAEQNPAQVVKPQSPDAKLSQTDLAEILAREGREHNLDVDLLASVVNAESGGNARALSRAGARGLMQLMPATAADLGVQDSYKPDQNVRGGSTYLDALLVHYHDNLALALAAYNAGPAAVDKYRGIPPYHETQAYVARVIHQFNRRVRMRQAQASHSVASAITH